MVITRFQTGRVEERLAQDFADPAGNGRTLVGYASVFNTPTLIREMGGAEFREQVAPGAFIASLSRRIPKVQYQHGRDSRIGTLPIGSMEVVREDDHGLWTESRLFRSAAAEDVREAVAAGALTGMSFSFRVTDETWTDSAGRTVDTERALNRLYRGEDMLRTLRTVELYEAGPVLTPAYESTSVGVRSALLGQGFTPGERATYLRGLVLRLSA